MRLRKTLTLVGLEVLFPIFLKSERGMLRPSWAGRLLAPLDAEDVAVVALLHLVLQVRGVRHIVGGVAWNQSLKFSGSHALDCRPAASPLRA
jgi:hypothetical protein